MQSPLLTLKHSTDTWRLLRNCLAFNNFVKEGYDYIVNLQGGELHKAVGGNFFGSHNLRTANFDSFVGLKNLQKGIPIHLNADGVRIPVFDIQTGYYVCEYEINKCLHCFPRHTLPLLSSIRVAAARQKVFIPFLCS